MLYTIIRSTAIVLFKILFRFKVYGRENLPEKGPFIIASNHLSFLDPVALGAACPKKISFLAREELFKLGLFSKLISAVGAFSVRKEAGDAEAIKEAIRKLKEGNVLALFPEGTRSRNGSLREAQGGVGLLAMKADVPIIPTLIEGSNKALPPDAKFIHFKKVGVRFGKPIILDKEERYEPKKETYLKIASQVMEEIGKLKNN